MINGVPHIMVGQPCQPYLVTTGSDAGNLVYLSNWTVTGITNLGYDPTVSNTKWTINPDPYMQSLGAIRPNGMYPYFYWDDPKLAQTETVECDITISGIYGPSYYIVLAAPLTYTIKKSILVERPQITAMGTSGNVEVLQNTQGNYGLPTTDWLLQAGSITQNVPGAMHTQVTVTMPPDFASLGNGSTSIQQFIEPEEFIEKTVNGPQIAGNYNNELYALDGGDFYNWTTTNTTGTVTTFSTQDSPYIDLTYFNATFGKLASTFEDYILWQPPEINTNYATCYMPLQDLTWNLDAAATEPTDKNGDPTGWTFANAGTVNITANYHNTQALPEWKQIVPSGNSFD